MSKNKKYYQNNYDYNDKAAIEIPMFSDDLPFHHLDYALDLDAICDFINYADKHESKEIAITDAEAKNVPLSYDTDGSIESDEVGKNMSSKEIREVRAHSNQQMDALRYDLVKMMIENVVNPGGMAENPSEGLRDFYGYITCFNTLLKHKFLVKVKKEDCNENNECYN